jgi:hypothetical protein
MEERAGFEADWATLHPEIPEGAFEEKRFSNAFLAWKDRMWKRACRMPSRINPPESPRSYQCTPWSAPLHAAHGQFSAITNGVWLPVVSSPCVTT